MERLPELKRVNNISSELLELIISLLQQAGGKDISFIEPEDHIIDLMIVTSFEAEVLIDSAVSLLETELRRYCNDVSLRVEGVAESGWVLVDIGDIVIHLFLPEVRQLYSIERLWELERLRRQKLRELSQRKLKGGNER